MKYYKLFLITVFFITFGCSHKMQIKSNNEEINQNSIKNEAIGIIKYNSSDLITYQLYNGFLEVIESNYNGKVIRNIDLNDKSSQNVIYDKIIEITYPSIIFDNNYIKSFCIQFPGLYIFMPLWNGLSYNIYVKAVITVYDKTGKNYLTSQSFNKTYIANYTSYSRVIANIFGWYPPIGIFSAFTPSYWDDEMKQEALKDLHKKFGIDISNQLISILSTI